MYRVSIERKAIKQLSKIPEPNYSKIKKAILDLAKDPRPAGYKKLKGKQAYRIRISDYRILYEIEDSQLKVFVITLGHRKDIYR